MPPILGGECPKRLTSGLLARRRTNLQIERPWSSPTHVPNPSALTSAASDNCLRVLGGTQRSRRMFAQLGPTPAAKSPVFGRARAKFGRHRAELCRSTADVVPNLARFWVHSWRNPQRLPNSASNLAGIGLGLDPVELAQMLPRIRPDVGQTPAEIANMCPIPGRIWHNSCRIRQNLTKTWPDLVDFDRHRKTLAEITQSWASFGQLWPTLGCNRPRLRNSGKYCPNRAAFGPMLVGVGPTLAKFGPNLTRFGV